MTELLWSNERIKDWVSEHWQGVGSAEALGTEMRDEYEAKINELERENDALAQGYKEILAELEETQANDHGEAFFNDWGE